MKNLLARKEALERQHRDLHNKIEKAEKHYAPYDMVTEMKLEKLKIKDEIYRIERMLG